MHGTSPLATAALAPLLAQQEPNLLASFFPLILLVVVGYFLLIRPQRKRATAQRELLASIDRGDRVVTIGGFHGRVESIDGETIRLELEPGTTVTLAKGAVARRLVDADTAGPGDDEMGLTDP